ncbi:MAG: thiamine-phosphate kinase [Thermomicrobiales bacterium]
MTQTVRDIGEFGLIAELRDTLSPEVAAGPGLMIGIGDDAAVWTPTLGESVVVTTDSLIEGIHFRLDWTDWRSLGHKALAVNLSDLAAMGAKPKLATITLGLTGYELVEDLKEFYRGIDALAAAHAIVVAGGDIVASPSGLALHVTMLGETRLGRVLTRSGARPGDLICVSGTLGAAAAGYRVLLEGENGPHTGLASTDLLVAAHLRPQPRIALGNVLLERGATAAMDLSDGLLGDLPKIVSMSDVRGMIDLRLLPVASAVRALFPDDWLELASRGGEDYELLFTLPPELFGEARAEADQVGSTISQIGEIPHATQAGPRLTQIDLDGIERESDLGAFDHFRN